MKYLALVAACLLAVTLAGPAVADDSATPTFTWPDVASFNPAVHPYEVTVSGAGDYPFRLVSNWRSLTVAGPGTYTYPFPVDGSGSWTDQVKVFHCVDGAACSGPLASSPILTMVKSLTPRWTAPDTWATVAPGASVTLPYSVSPTLSGTVLRWYVVRSGEAPAVALAWGDVLDPDEATVTVPADLPEGRFEVILRADLERDPYGHLAGDSDRFPLFVDSTAPTPRIEVRRPTFYPLTEDLEWAGYLPVLEFNLYADEITTGTLTITGPTGVVLTREGYDVRENGSFDEWDGKVGHQVAPEGSYELRLDVVDEAGNAGTVTDSVFLSHSTLHNEKVTGTVRAARTIVSRSVGACSSLTIPSSHRWKGSVGYASQTRCRRPDKSPVVTVNRLYLPKAFHRSYNIHMSFFGVASRVKPGSSLASGWFDRKGKIPGGFTFARGPIKRWNTLPQDTPPIQVDDRGRPYVLWAMITNDDDRYDVKSFRYRIRYSAFR